MNSRKQDSDSCSSSSLPRYSRQERLKHSSVEVQRMYQSDYISRPGLLGALTATRAVRAVLFALVVVVLVLVFNLIILQHDRYKKNGFICGVPVQLTAAKQDTALYVHILLLAVETDIEMPLFVSLVSLGANGAVITEKTVSTVYLGSKMNITVELNGSAVHRVRAVIQAEESCIILEQDKLE